MDSRIECVKELDNADKQSVESVKPLLRQIRRSFPESGIIKISYTVYLTDQIPEHVYDKGKQAIDENALRGRECYAKMNAYYSSKPRPSGRKQIMKPQLLVGDAEEMLKSLPEKSVQL